MENNMTFSVKERVILLDFVPKEGNILFVKMVQNFLEELSFSDDENKILCFHQTLKGQILWDEEAAGKISKDIIVPDTLKDQIAVKLMKLNDKNKLSVDHIEIYERFVGELKTDK